MTENKLKFILPAAILVVAIVVTIGMLKSRAPVGTRPPQDFSPLVRVVEATPVSHQFSVWTQGTVKPRTETALVSEVAGRVTSVAPSFADGGFFEKGDVLVTVDPRDYELAVITARGQVAQAKVRAELEEAQAEVAREEWKSLGAGKESPLATREPQVQEARAAFATAEAALEKAERNLDRTRMRAPFAGRVRQKLVDVGQYISPGVPVAHIFAVDYVEVRLPIPDSDLAYLELPVNYRGDTQQHKGPDVILHADFAGMRHSWRGRIVRVEGEIDPVSRMVHAIAQVDDPYGRGEGQDQLPLAIGLFVDAEIKGRTIENAVIVPRSAIRGDSTVYVIDDDGHLRFRDVTVARLGHDTAVISGGLDASERVCVSLLDTVTDGMKVRTTESIDNAGTDETEERNDS